MIKKLMGHFMMVKVLKLRAQQAKSTKIFSRSDVMKRRAWSWEHIQLETKKKRENTNGRAHSQTIVPVPTTNTSDSPLDTIESLNGAKYGLVSENSSGCTDMAMGGVEVNGVEYGKFQRLVFWLRLS